MKSRVLSLALALTLLLGCMGALPVHAEEIPDVTQYSYTVTPILSPFCYYLYVQTDNPDPFSFRLVDESSQFYESGEQGEIRIRTSENSYSSTSVDPGTYYQDPVTYCDVVYEDPATYRVKGGYIFRAQKAYSDGGEFVLLQKTSSGNTILRDTFQKTDVVIPCQPLETSISYLINACTTDSMDFFEKMDAVQTRLSEIAVYPRDVCDSSKPNKQRPYPYLLSSAYTEHPLIPVSDTFETIYPGLFASEAYPFVLNSYTFPLTMCGVAYELDQTCEVFWDDYYHERIDVVYEGESHSYGGAGDGGSDPLYSSHVKQVFTFQGEDDFGLNGSIEDFYTLLRAYEPLARKDAEHNLDLVQGDTFDQIIRQTGGTWIRVVSGTGYAYVVPLGDGTRTVSDGWVDGRYITNQETIGLYETFNDHPQADIVLQDVAYTDRYGVEHIQDVIYEYDSKKDEWRAPYFYNNANWCPVNMEIPDVLVLTREEVEAMDIDRMSNHLIESGLIYDGREPPGTPFTQKIVSGVSAPEAIELTIGDSMKLCATVEPIDAAETHVTWTSSNPEVANVPFSDNMLRTYKAGTAILTVTTFDGYYSAQCIVIVLPDPCEQGHTEVIVSAIPPTCGEIGWSEGKRCAVCGETLVRQHILDSLGHSTVYDKAIAPTCTQTGLTRGKHCSTCDVVFEAQQVIPARGHEELTDKAVAATCTKDGKTEGKHCSVCGAVTVEQKTVAATGHKEVTDAAVAATCTTDGKTEGKHCSVCGKVFAVQQTVKAPGHKEVIDAAVAATCTTDGKTEGKHCSVCGTVIVAQQTVKATGHKEVTDKAVAATCTKDGKTAGKHCSVCGTVTVAQQTVKATGHSFANGKCGTCGAEDPNYVKPTEPQPTEPKPEAQGVTRVLGTDRYQTSFKSADQLKAVLGVSKFQNIVVSSGTDFADALAGSYLAAQKDAPILLVRNRAKEMDAVKDYIKANLAPGGTVYLLGGVNAVPKTMETGLDGFNVKRLGGATRYDTNLLILKEAGVGNKDIIVCTDKNFADSLSASATGLPILLVKDNLYANQKEFLATTSGKKIIVGGNNAVNTTIEKQLATYGSVKRLAGNTRYNTSVLVAQEFFQNPTSAVLAYAQNFPDGLSGGPLAYALKAPLILTDSNKPTAAVKYATGIGIKNGYVLGGTGLISDKVAKNIFSMVSSDPIVVK